MVEWHEVPYSRYMIKIGEYDGTEFKRTICVFDNHAQNHELSPEQIADVKLISAAPDLLAACQAFVKAWEKSLQLEKTDIALRMAKQAIEKAQPNKSLQWNG